MAQNQLRTAHALIEHGRIDEARRLLQTLDDPTARLWLNQLDANKRIRKADRRLSRRLSMPLLVALAVVIGIITLVIMLLLTPTLINQIQSQSQDHPNAQSLLAADEQLRVQLIQYCTPKYGTGAAACLNWADEVVAQHRGEALACLAQYAVQTPEERAQVADCLTTNGVPLP